MPVWVTVPPQPFIVHPVFTRLRDLWLHVTNGECRFRQAIPHQTHGPLLNDIWTEIRSSDEGMHLISEIDVIPAPELLRTVEELFTATQPFAMFPFNCRRAKDRTLTIHNTDPVLSAPWFIALDLAGMEAAGRTPTSLDWLDASGPFHDACNEAHLHLPPDKVLHISPAPEIPGELGLDYPGLGYHCFFSMYYSAPPARKLFADYTVGQHLEVVSRRLDEAGV